MQSVNILTITVCCVSAMEHVAVYSFRIPMFRLVPSETQTEIRKSPAGLFLNLAVYIFRIPMFRLPPLERETEIRKSPAGLPCLCTVEVSHVKDPYVVS